MWCKKKINFEKIFTRKKNIFARKTQSSLFLETPQTKHTKQTMNNMKIRAHTQNLFVLLF